MIVVNEVVSGSKNREDAMTRPVPLSANSFYPLIMLLNPAGMPTTPSSCKTLRALS